MAFQSVAPSRQNLCLPGCRRRQGSFSALCGPDFMLNPPPHKERKEHTCSHTTHTHTQKKNVFRKSPPLSLSPWAQSGTPCYYLFQVSQSNDRLRPISPGPQGEVATVAVPPPPGWIEIHQGIAVVGKTYAKPLPPHLRVSCRFSLKPIPGIHHHSGVN